MRTGHIAQEPDWLVSDCGRMTDQPEISNSSFRLVFDKRAPILM